MGKSNCRGKWSDCSNQLLGVELKSMNSIHILLLQMYQTLECRGYCNHSGAIWQYRMGQVKEGVSLLYDFRPVKALHYDGGECYGALIVEVLHCGLVQHWF